MSTSTPQTSGLSKLKVAELREKLSEQGLDTQGTKPVLLARLRESLSIVSTPTKTEEAAGKTITPARRSKRISESFSDILETGGVNLLKKDSRPGTPLKKMKQELQS